jgi:WD40 repeat protein
MKRRWRDADVYLLFNEGAQSLDSTVTLSSAPGTAKLWDARTGSVTPLPVHSQSGSPSVTLHFAPYESHVVVLRETSAPHKKR